MFVFWKLNPLARLVVPDIALRPVVVDDALMMRTFAVLLFGDVLLSLPQAPTATRDASARSGTPDSVMRDDMGAASD
jgi:hypothetical protein